MATIDSLTPNATPAGSLFIELSSQEKAALSTLPVSTPQAAADAVVLASAATDATTKANAAQAAAIAAAATDATTKANAAQAAAIAASATSDLSNAAARKDLLRRRIASAVVSPAVRVMTSPPTVTLATSSQITNGMFHAAGSGSSSASLRGAVEYFTYSRGAFDTSANFGLGVSFNNITANSTPTYSAATFCVSFLVEDTEFEIVLQGSSTSFVVKVDDEYVSLTPTSLTSGGALQYYKHVFATRSARRVSVIGQNLSFGGVVTGPTGTLSAAPIRGPRVICFGDSFTAATPLGYTEAIADYFGWDDVWASGLGGTGYVTTGSGVTLPARVARDVIGHSPEVILILAGMNDGYGATAVTAAATMIAQIKAALPAAYIAVAVNYAGGVNEQSTTSLQFATSMRAACVAADVVFIDLLERPFAPTGLTMQSGALTQGYSAGTSGTSGGTPGVRINYRPRLGSTIELSGLERIQVKSWVQDATNTYRVQFDGALQYAHSAAGTAVQVGGAFWTGRGNAGATTGFGNSDVYVSADGTHPTGDGNRALGIELGSRFLRAMRENILLP